MELKNKESYDVSIQPSTSKNEIGLKIGKKELEEVDRSGAGFESGKMYYEIEDVPSWIATIFLSFQVYLMMAATALSGPHLITDKMCMGRDNPDRARVVSTFMLISGFVTILQSSFGTRLPIVQGGSAAFLVSTLAILEGSGKKCPSAEELGRMSVKEQGDLWKGKMVEIQGAIILASLFQVFFGLFGLVGLILKYITPLTVAPSITMIGISLFGFSGFLAGGEPDNEPYYSNWPISICTIIFIVVLSQYFRDVRFPIPFTKSPKRNGTLTYKVFQSFPILLGLGIMFIICWIITECNGFPDRYPAATNFKIMREADFFIVPFPFQWGVPTVNYGTVFGILTAVMAGIVESIGDYYACARIVGAKAPPLHAINRGIFIEGIGCILAGIWGTGSGTTSYSENTGSIGVTQVGSRRVIQIGGVIMVLLSVFGKLNAFFVSIPEPIIGAFLVVAFSMITAVGLSNLKGVDLSSARNLFVIGFSMFFSLTVSQWVRGQKHFLLFSDSGWNQMFKNLLSTPMFMAGLFGFILDNTIPGSRKERGLDEWEKNFGAWNYVAGSLETSYDVPFITFYLQKYEFTKWIPISPTFDGTKYRKEWDKIVAKIAAPFMLFLFICL